MIKNKTGTAILKVLFLLLLILAFKAEAREEVLDLKVLLSVQEDSSIIIKESIRVNIKQKIIKHGITHAFPVKKLYENKKLRHFGYELLSVKLDGREVNYYLEKAAYYAAIAIGDEDRAAPLGVHTYEIEYKTDGHIHHLEDMDMLYYNIISDGWAFPIKNASFTLKLPGDNKDAIIKSTAYTGDFNQKGQDYIKEAENLIRTSRTLEPGEGFTVEIAWKKGIVEEQKESLASIIGANRNTALFISFIIILLYFTLIRSLFIPKAKGIIVPLFSPPEGMSPGYVSALKNMRFSGEILHADLIWAASHNFFSLDARNKKKIILEQREVSEEEKKWSNKKWIYKQCLKLKNTFFSEEDKEAKLDLLSEKGEEKAVKAFEYLEEKYSKEQKNFWKTNYSFNAFGLILFAGLFYKLLSYIYSPMLEMDIDFAKPVEFLLTFTLIHFFLFIPIYAIYKKIYLDKDRRYIIITILSSSILFFISFYILWDILAGDYIFTAYFTPSFAICFISVIKNPKILSEKGKEKHFQIKGLEMYIKTAEKERLAKINAPEDTIEKFEELLAYAIALNCAEIWQKRFDSILLAGSYTPTWIYTDAYDRQDQYKQNYRFALDSISGVQAALVACEKISKDAKSSSSSSGSSSGSGGGSVGGGSGGSRVGGW